MCSKNATASLDFPKTAAKGVTSHPQGPKFDLKDHFLCGVTDVLPVSALVSSEFYSFLPINMPEIKF